MSKTYVIGDLHGRYDLLQMALSEIGKRVHSGRTPATVIMLGDYVDRGLASRQIIELLMDGIGTIKLICLKGNHEEIMYETCRKPLDPNWWLGNGGGQTLMSYGHSARGPIDLSVVSDVHLDWIGKLPYMHVDKHRVYVHAGVDASRPLADQVEAFTGSLWERTRLVTWWRYGDTEQGGHGNYHVLHGHTPYKEGPMRYQGRTNLDTYAWRTGRLVVGVFDDDTPGGPVGLIEVIGKPFDQLVIDGE